MRVLARGEKLAERHRLGRHGLLRAFLRFLVGWQLVGLNGLQLFDRVHGLCRGAHLEDGRGRNAVVGSFFVACVGCVRQARASEGVD